MAEAPADARCHHKEMLHDNQPEWTRGMRGAQQEATTRQESAQADGRHRRDDRNRDNQLDKRREGGAMRGGGALRGGGAGGREAAV